MESEKLETKAERILESKGTPTLWGTSSASFFPRPTLKFSKMRERVLLHFMKGEYSKLKQTLYQYGLTETEITDFFSEEGRTLLSYSLIDAINDEPLKFLVEVISVQALQAVLSQDNFDVLQSFLLGQVGLEEYGLYDEETGEAQIKKFEGLLRIDKEGIVNFMRENADDPDFESDKIKANFEKALAEYAAKNASSQESSCNA